MSNNFHKTLLLEIHKLETLGTRKSILRTKFEQCTDVAVLESIQ